MPTVPDYVGGVKVDSDAGYIKLPDTQKSLYYWITFSSGDRAKDPLVVWFNGGPGCSSLEGAWTEVGPYRMNGEGKVDFNGNAWTRWANVLFIEAPAGVGFSYSTNKTDYVTNDLQTAKDNYDFLVNWMEKFPEFKGRDLWLTGESYAGVYVPTLAYNIVKGPNSDLSGALKGLMMGNPVIRCSSVDSNKEQFNNFYYHGLVSWDMMRAWRAAGCETSARDKKCGNILVQATVAIGVQLQPMSAKQQRVVDDFLVGYQPTTELDVDLTSGGDDSNFHLKLKMLMNQKKRRSQAAALTKRSQAAAPKHPYYPEPSLDPDDLYEDFCTGNGTLLFATTPRQNNGDDCKPIGTALDNYLNRADVQKALHAKVGTHWMTCTDVLDYSANAGSMVDYYTGIWELNSSVELLVYSGDVDISTVYFPETLACIGELNDKTGGSPVSKWQPWFVNGATAGYAERYTKFTYATVKGAGHEVPHYQPFTSTAMFERFLLKQSLTGSMGDLVVGGDNNGDVDQHAMQVPRVPQSSRRTQGDVYREMRWRETEGGRNGNVHQNPDDTRRYQYQQQRQQRQQRK